MPTTIRSSAAIAGDLATLGVVHGDLLMVHASLRAIGPVEAGADGVLEAIHMAIGERGTMLMVLGARNDHAWVNRHPEPERPGLLVDAVPFDASTTPADPGVGVLAEVFRRRPGTRVSDHPEGRFAAAGPAAASLLADVPWDDYFGPGSPLERLADGHGKVLRLGADPDTVTLLHYAEYRCALEHKRRVRRHRLVSTPDGPRIRVVECLDDEDGIVDVGGEDYFSRILRAYLAAGRGRVGLVGRARSELLDAADLAAFGTRWMDTYLRASRPPTRVEALQARLDADLSHARRRRSLAEVAAIRSLKAALANAEVVPLPDDRYHVVQGSADVPRRGLDHEEIAAVVAAEVVELERAIAQRRAAGLEVASLEEQLATLRRFEPS